jgi:hypothetical protein
MFNLGEKVASFGGAKTTANAGAEGRLKVGSLGKTLGRRTRGAAGKKLGLLKDKIGEVKSRAAGVGERARTMAESMKAKMGALTGGTSVSSSSSTGGNTASSSKTTTGSTMPKMPGMAKMTPKMPKMPKFPRLGKPSNELAGKITAVKDKVMAKMKAAK